MLQGLPIGFVILVVAVFLVAVSAVGTWVIKLGGAPDEENGELVYRLRPAMKFTAILAGLLGLTGVVSGLLGLRTPRDFMWILWLFGGTGLVLCALFILSARIYLNEAGLSYRRGWKHQTTISWRDLHHYEMMTNRNWKTGINTRVIFFVSVDDRSIPVDESGYDAGDLLRRIQVRKHLKEQPYKQRNWYGD
jgi:hypothetical protein